MPPMVGEAQRDPVLIQALCLYLLIFAFFIALYNVSRTDDSKAKVVTASVQASFAEGVVTPIDIGQSLSESGRVLTPVEFLGQLGRVVQTNLPLSKFDIVRADRTLEIRVPLASLFADGSTRPRREVIGLADRIAASVLDMPTGIFIDVDFVLPVRSLAELLARERAPIEMVRSAALASLFSERSGQRGSTAAAIAVTEPGLARVMFHLRFDGDHARAPAARSRAGEP